MQHAARDMSRPAGRRRAAEAAELLRPTWLRVAVLVTVMSVPTP